MRFLPQGTKQQGFTILEFCIVIVLVGLIIGGVLVGQDLLRNAELNSVVSGVDKYRAAIASFKLKYGQYPGDLDNASSYWPTDCVDDAESTCNGDGDGNIALSVAGANPKPYEHRRVWQHLSLAGLIEGSYNGDDPYDAASAAGVTIPKAPRDGGFQVVYESQNYLSSYWDRRFDGAYITWGQWAGTFGSADSWGGSIVSPADSKSIDLKIDDGKVRDGKVQNYTGTDDYSGCYTSHNQPTDYDMSYEGADCWMFFYIDE